MRKYYRTIANPRGELIYFDILKHFWYNSAMAERDRLSNPDSQARFDTALKAISIIIDSSEGAVTQIDLFGSTVNNTATFASDIDICVRLGRDVPNRLGLFIGGQIENKLREHGFLTGVHVPMGFDTTVLNEAYFDEDAELSEIIRGRVEEIKKTGITIYTSQATEK